MTIHGFKDKAFFFLKLYNSRLMAVQYLGSIARKFQIANDSPDKDDTHLT